MPRCSTALSVRIAHTTHYVQPLPSRFWPNSGRFWPKPRRSELKDFLLVYLTHSYGKISIVLKYCSTRLRRKLKYTSDTSKLKLSVKYHGKLAELDPEPSQLSEPQQLAEPPG